MVLDFKVNEDWVVVRQPFFFFMSLHHKPFTEEHTNGSILIGSRKDEGCFENQVIDNWKSNGRQMIIVCVGNDTDDNHLADIVQRYIQILT